MRLIALGDCVADRYIDEGIYFPGGQAVNVAVNAKRDGAEVSAYVGLFGDDVPAQYIQQVLADEGVVTARCRHAYGRTPGPSVRIVDGERIFGRGKRDSVAHLFRLRLVDEDFAYLSTFDVCHTTNDAGVDAQLPELHKAVPLSYDFSTGHDAAYLERVCPHIDIAFFSGEGMDVEEAEELMHRAAELGCRIVVVTLGVRGSLCFDGRRVWRQDAVKTDAIDTMGAGDSFAAAFLVRYMDEHDCTAALAYAAECAARTCCVRGAFGCSAPLDSED